MGRKKKTPGAGVPAPEWVQYASPGLAELLQAQADLDRLKQGPHTFADVAKAMRRLSELDRGRKYRLTVPESLQSAGQAYYDEHAEALRAALTEGGADAETIAAVLYDYGAALCGLDFTATPTQMFNALKACSASTAYHIDKYGVFFGLLYRYQRNLSAFAEYAKGVKGEQAAARRDLFFNTEIGVCEFSDPRAAALHWLWDIGLITANDFAGIAQDTITRFLAFVELYGQSGDFVQYVYIARHALHASPEQLAQLPPPVRFRRHTTNPIQAALDYADIIGKEITIILARTGEQVQAAVPREQPKTARGVVQILREPKPGQIITIPEEHALMLGRPLFASADGKQASEILPISAFIADHLKRNESDSLPVTPELLEKAVEGVNLLQQLKRTQPANGIYTLKTNLTEFSALCGYKDANQTEKRQLLTALRVLHNLYIVLWKPTGRVAVQLFGVQQYPLAESESELVLNVFASGFRGRPQFWDAAQYKLIRQREKGAPSRRFRHQITAIGHATEDNLLTDVFGYDKLRAEAARTHDANQIKAVEEYIRKHKGRDRKRLARMFDDYAADGVITYTANTNKKGQTVYKWNRLKPITPGEPEQETAK